MFRHSEEGVTRKDVRTVLHLVKGVARKVDARKGVARKGVVRKDIPFVLRRKQGAARGLRDVGSVVRGNLGVDGDVRGLLGVDGVARRWSVKRVTPADRVG